MGYGIVGRGKVAAGVVVGLARERGIRAGLPRPITLYPFPQAELRALARNVKAFVRWSEMSTGQLVEDVRLALGGKAAPVEFYSRVGGNVPSAEELLDFLQRKFTPSRGAERRR